MNQSAKKVVVVGLGYVGLPLAVALARQFNVTGLDIDRTRVDELLHYHDRTGELEELTLRDTALKITCAPEDCKAADIFIVTVPTPVDAANIPDLRPLVSASRMVGKLMEAGRQTVVVFESTVYPGVTEDICGPLLEEESGLVCGQDFYLGYSPERINPGDREHTVERIVKVVAGQNEEITDLLAEIYGSVTSAGVFRAASIKVAEAAKVIENAQRDINIAFMNEITQIFAKLDLSIWEVLEAAGTKWNFLPFQPGLVGGHCIGVDPYYLSHRAKELGYEPRVILSGRSTNDGMGEWVADSLHERRDRTPGSVLVLGITFKENVPDLRNSRVIDVIRRLVELGHQVTVHDPEADEDEAFREYGVRLNPKAMEASYDVVFAAVAHSAYAALSVDEIRRLTRPGGLAADLKGIWRRLRLDPAIDRWSL